jgi:hypothetical protein
MPEAHENHNAQQTRSTQSLARRTAHARATSLPPQRRATKAKIVPCPVSCAKAVAPSESKKKKERDAGGVRARAPKHVPTPPLPRTTILYLEKKGEVSTKEKDDPHAADRTSDDVLLHHL